jgi:hypothetical protein
MSLRDPNVSNSRRRKRVAIVISNPAVSTTTGWPVGFWWSELTHPYYVLTEAGYEVEVFSPDGGKCEADAMSDPRDPSGYSATDLISMGFIATAKLAKLVESTRKISEIEGSRFDAIIVAGGQAPMFTYDKAIGLHQKFVEFMRPERLRRRCATASPFSATPSSPVVSISPRGKALPASPMSKKTLPTMRYGA